MDYRLQDLVDIPKLQSLLDNLFVSSGIPSAILDREGKVLTGAGWQDICTKFHRVHPESLKDCIHSDVTIAAGLTASTEHAQVTCPRGLTDTATPLVVEGQHLANVFTGQLFIAEPEREQFRRQARQFGFDEVAYLAAFDKVPSISQKQLDEHLTFIAQLAEQMAIQGLNQLRTLRAEAALRQSEARYRRISEGLTDYQYRVRVEDGRAVATEHSQGCEGVTGYTVEDFAADPYLWFTMIAPEHRELAVARVARILAGEEIPPFEHRIRRKDGTLGWVSDLSILEKDAAGRLIAYDGIVKDITEIHRALEELREVRQTSEQVIACAQEGVIVYGSDLRYQVWNPFMEQLSGLPASEVLGKHPREVFPFLSEAGVMDRLERALAGEKVDSVDIPLPMVGRGRTGWVTDTSAPFRNAMGELVGVIGTVSDISARKQAELDRAQSHELLANLAGLVPGVVYQYRLYPDGRSAFPYSSPGMSDIYEVTPEEVRLDATPVFGRLHPDDYDSVAEAIQDSARTLEEFYAEFRVILPRQGLRWRWSQAHPQRLEDGSTLWHGIILDITDRKQVEEDRRSLQAQLQQSQKMESLGTLAGGVAHDMNNVLGAIMALASVHHLQAREGTPLHSNMETIHKACQRGSTLVKGLLGFARQELAEARELDLNILVQEEVALLERTTLKKIQLEMDLAEDLKPVKGDPAALSHGLMNLCVNAVDAMPEGGLLTLRTRNEGAGTVLLEVVDSGCGMPRAVLEKALDPFFTTKPKGKGTGLGLPIVYGMVESHGGQMELLSEPGQGTRVRLHFPACAPQSPGSADVADSRAECSQPALAILLIDDDELIQRAVEAVLERLGHTSTTVPSGEAALAALAEGLQPDVAILDMNMPGLGGAGTLQGLRALRPDLPVLLATGHADQAALHLIQAFPNTTLLAKPFTLGELQAQLSCLERVRPQVLPTR